MELKSLELLERLKSTSALWHSACQAPKFGLRLIQTFSQPNVVNFGNTDFTN